MSADTPLLQLVIDALEEVKAQNITQLDVREITSVADNMVIASGTSNRHVKALADNVVEAAKNGDAEAAVVLSLLGDCDIGGSCEGIVLDPLNPAAPITGAEPAPRIRQFTESFTYGSVGPVCSADYAPFFLEAVSVIDSACDDFVPPG